MVSALTVISNLLAKISVPITIFVAGIYLLRVLGKRYDNQHWINNLNRSLRKKHIPLSIVLIVITLIHGLTSFIGLFSLTWGTASWVSLVLLALSYYLRKKLDGKWIKWHRVLTVVFIVLLALHLYELPALRTLYLNF